MNGTTEQIGHLNPSTWRMVPGEMNVGECEDGTWAIAGGDGDEYDLYIEVLDTDHSKQVAAFLLDAVRQHARKVWAEGAMADVLQAREQRDDGPLGEPNMRPVGWAQIGDLMQQVGAISDLYSQGPLKWAERQRRLYPLLAQMAASLLVSMEWIRAEEITYGPAA